MYIEFMKSFISNICLFTVFDAIIFCLFFNIIGKCKKFKIYELLVVTLFIGIVFMIFPILYSQSFCIVCMTIYLIKRDKISFNRSLKVVLLANAYMLILEMSYFMFFDFMNIIDISLLDKLSLHKFIVILPMRVIEIGLLLIFRRKNIWEHIGAQKSLNQKLKKLTRTKSKKV